MLAQCFHFLCSLNYIVVLGLCNAICSKVDNNFYQMPERWLEATGECFVLCIGVSWLVTAMFNPGVALTLSRLRRLSVS